MKYFFFLLLIYTLTISPSSAASCAAEDQQCIEVGQWELAVAVGAGVITNPVRDGDNVPLVVLPYISYYGDKFFVDNTTVGYTFVEKPQYDLSLITQLNTERAYFERFHPSNILVSNSFSQESGSPSNPVIDPHPDTGTDSDSPDDIDGDKDNVDPDDKQTKKSISIDDIAKRDWALDSGFLAHWYLEKYGKLSILWLHDVTGTYRGYHGQIDYSYHVPVGQPHIARLKLKVGAEYKSQKLVDYYYGISPLDTESEYHLYTGKATINPFVSIAFNYRLNQDWQLKFSAKQTWLGSGITDSPLIDKKYTSNVFIGGVYEF
ncbi:MipA/OmpV family protein [Pseudoalteromonas sp. SMS1]|uniref:MipA/OmpV family protein n=1 Tax=Pseudoalteromonas sp. SMS1 TaxID=2908894 RepID=UPI001F22EB63|nr:MipA/OmpV family protein [Pseudoalteromonas sp. SMS1]MCF2857647.1 MipA/OmpV family protein [Pseudoalteromonas sp. SMS1]